MGVDPCAYFSRFEAKQAHREQFTEDIGKIISGQQGGGYNSVGTVTLRGSAGSRTRSPGLAAGAALALGAESTAYVNPCAEARAARLQAVERSRGSSCPFDNHAAFGFGAAITDHRRENRLSA